MTLLKLVEKLRQIRGRGRDFCKGEMDSGIRGGCLQTD